jgi:ribokinase
MKHRTAVTVVGSANMDLIVRSPRIPAVGETILGTDFFMLPGGKGANQAVAAAKVGARVHFVAKLGEDMYGNESLSNFKSVGIDTKYITRTKDAPSGVALINIDDKGRNQIVVIPGANARLSPSDVQSASSAIEQSAVVVAQLEIQLATVQKAAELARKHDTKFILNPAPAQTLPAKLLASVDILTPNETEASLLTDISVTDLDSARKASIKLLECGVKAVIITMGAQGFLLTTSQQNTFVKAVKVNPVDSTAAGDAFTGSLAASLAWGKSLKEASEFANYVAALSVTKVGAQASMPTMKEVETFMAEKSKP